MKKYLLTILSVLFCVLNSWAQPYTSADQRDGKVKWTAGPETMPGNLKAFQENRGQFKNLINDWKILYGAEYDGGIILFTDHGVIYSLPEMVADKGDEDADKNKEEEEKDGQENKQKEIFHNVSIEWQHANANLTVEAQNETPFYFGSILVQGADNQIKGYGKLIYHNVYPGIDIEYTFRNGKGIEYALKVKPGADASVVQMLYGGEEKGLSIDADGNVHIATKLGDIIDHAPQSSQNGNPVESAFKKVGNNKIAFQLGTIDPSSTLVIDPWTVSPLATTFIPSDVHMDGANNVYIYGQGNTKLYEQKYTAAGALSWTYAVTYARTGTISDLAVSNPGTSYIAMPYYDANGSGGEYGMVSLTTTMAANFFNNNSTATQGTTTTPASVFEVWNVVWSCDYSELIEGGAPTTLEEEVAVVNSATGALGNETIDNLDGEIYAGCIAPNGNYYAIAANPCFSPCGTPGDNVVCYTLTAGNATRIWSTLTNYVWDDYDTKNYNGIATNGIDAGCAFLYTTDGYKLNQRSLTTGASITQVNIPGAVNGGTTTTGGVAVDIGCGNVYVGSTTAVEIFTPTLGVITNQPTPGPVLGVCYENNLLAACGGTSSGDFVMVFDAQPCNVISITHTNDVCNEHTATATVTATFCTGGAYEYLWTPTGQTTQTASGLSAGSYTVAVGSTTGCTTITDTVTITQPPIPTVTMGAIVDPSCNVTGSATCIPASGVTPYTYLWSGGGGTNITGTGLGAGVYTVTVTDANGCTVTATATLTGTSTTASIAPPTQPLCFGDATTATASATGGTAPYTYAWSTTPTQSTVTATGLTAGTYTVGVSSASGCTASATVVITQPTLVSATTTMNPAACGVSNGSSTVTATGGTLPYTYAWTGGGGNIATDPNLSAGSYTATVTDNHGCTATSVVTVTSTGGTTANITGSTNVSCFGGDNGTATGSGAGGVAPYTYLWNNAQSTAMANGLAAGTYTVTVTDNQGCTGTADVAITQPTALGTTTSFTAASCNLFNGSATVTVTGGISPYAYLWNPTPQTTATAAGVSAGTYSVTVTDANGCTTTATVTVTQPSAVVAYIVSTTGISCFGGNNGTITADASGGVAPYGYAWTPSGGNAATAAALSIGCYTVTVHDANGCISTATACVTQPAVLTANINGPSIICAGTTGTLTANVGGGTEPYNYTWSGVGIASATSTASVSPTVTETYTVTITDANGCTASAQFTINLGPPLTVTAPPATVCPGMATSLCATVTGGTGGYLYTWTSSTGASYSTPCIIVSPTASTTFTISVVDNCGSTGNTITTVQLNPYPLVDFSADLYQGCVPLCVQFYNATTVPGGSAESYSWLFGNGDSSHVKNPTYCYPTSGIYNVSLTVVSDSGCSATLKKIKMITVFPPPVAAFTVSPQPATILNPTIQFTNTSTGEYPISYWFWNFGDGSADSTSNTAQNPTHTYGDTGTYCPSLAIMDEHGCTDTTTNCLIIDPIFTLYIPSAFTPNGGGLNELFTAKGEYVKTFEMYIFDRWGEQLYHTTDINKGWDGTVKGGSTVSQEDVYVYKIIATDYENNQHSYIGSVTLIK